MSTSWLIDNAPPWLVLVFIGIGVSAYLAVGLLVLGSRLRTAAAGATARDSRSERTRVLWAASRRDQREVTTS